MSDRQIQEAVQKLAGVQLSDSVTLADAEVTAVDLSTRSCTCRVFSGHSEFILPGVRLMATIDDGVLIVPSVGSHIIVAYSKRVTPFISQFSQVGQVLIITGGTSLSVTDGLLQINDGSFGGLIKVEALVTKLNNLENLLNDLVTKFNTHIHPASSGTTSPTTTQETSTIAQKTKKADLENTKVKHGQ